MVRIRSKKHQDVAQIDILGLPLVLVLRSSIIAGSALLYRPCVGIRFLTDALACDSFPMLLHVTLI